MGWTSSWRPPANRPPSSPRLRPTVRRNPPRSLSRSFAMSPDSRYDAKVSAAQQLYRALAAGDRDALGSLLHPEFVGHATEGLPMDMGGEHVGPENMQKKLWWRIGRHYKVEAQVDEFRALNDGRLFVAGHYRGEARVSGKTLDASFIHVIGCSSDGRISALDQLTDSAAWVEALGGDPPLQTIDYSVVDGVATMCLN